MCSKPFFPVVFFVLFLISTFGSGDLQCPQMSEKCSLHLHGEASPEKQFGCAALTFGVRGSFVCKSCTLNLRATDQKVFWNLYLVRKRRLKKVILSWGGKLGVWDWVPLVRNFPYLLGYANNPTFWKCASTLRASGLYCLKTLGCTFLILFEVLDCSYYMGNNTSGTLLSPCPVPGGVQGPPGADFFVPWQAQDKEGTTYK
jgi:hypothetical protein